MMRSKKKKYWFVRNVRDVSDVYFHEPDSYDTSSRRVKKFAARLVFTGMLLMFPEIVILCLNFPVPWASFWALLFVIGAFANLGGYACLVFGWHFNFQYIRNITGFIRRNFMRTGGGTYARRKR